MTFYIPAEGEMIELIGEFPIEDTTQSLYVVECCRHFILPKMRVTFPVYLLVDERTNEVVDTWCHWTTDLKYHFTCPALFGVVKAADVMMMETGYPMWVLESGHMDVVEKIDDLPF